MNHLTRDDLPTLREGQELLLTCGAGREPAPVDGYSVEVTSDVFLAAVPGGSTWHSSVELLRPDGEEGI